MKKVLTIWRKEALGHATSPRAYVMVALTFAFTAVWFFVWMMQVREASLRGIMSFVSFLLLAITPIVTMRTIAEENSRGTLELLLTSPVRESDIVLGKFLGAMTLYGAFFVSTLIFPVILFAIGEPEKGPLFTQYLGLVLSSAAFISVGLFASSITESQVIAAIVSYIVLLAFYVIGIFAPLMPTSAGTVAKSLALSQHLDNFFKGIVDAVDVYYYVAFTGIFLFLTWRAIEARRWA